jgi:hypothetical protein
MSQVTVSDQLCLTSVTRFWKLSELETCLILVHNRAVNSHTTKFLRRQENYLYLTPQWPRVPRDPLPPRPHDLVTFVIAWPLTQPGTGARRDLDLPLTQPGTAYWPTDPVPGAMRWFCNILYYYRGYTLMHQGYGLQSDAPSTSLLFQSCESTIICRARAYLRISADTLHSPYNDIIEEKTTRLRSRKSWMGLTKAICNSVYSTLDSCGLTETILQQVCLIDEIDPGAEWLMVPAECRACILVFIKLNTNNKT